MDVGASVSSVRYFVIAGDFHLNSSQTGSSPFPYLSLLFLPTQPTPDLQRFFLSRLP